MTYFLLAVALLALFAAIEGRNPVIAFVGNVIAACVIAAVFLVILLVALEDQ